jgi:CheY-like chemotaxis protein
MAVAVRATVDVDSSMTSCEGSPCTVPGTPENLMGRSEEMSPFARRREAAPWVLIVDDDPLTARATGRLIAAATGLEVSVVGDVEQALEHVTRSVDGPVAVVLDYDLRDGEKGLTVLLSLRANGFEVPCAFHTGAPAKARSALAKSRLEFDGGYPIFDKAKVGAQDLVGWLAARVPVTARVKDSPHRSGVRSKLV